MEDKAIRSENQGLKKELINYLREGSILVGGLILLEFILVFPQELATVGFDLETLTYTGQISIIRALGIGFVRAIVLSVIGAFKKLARKA